MTKVEVIGIELNKVWKYQGREGVNNYLHVRFMEPISEDPANGYRVSKLKVKTSVKNVYALAAGDVVGIEWDRFGNPEDVVAVSE